MKVKIGAVEIEITSGYLRYDADSDTVFFDAKRRANA